MTHVSIASLFPSAQRPQPAVPDFAQRCQAATGILFSAEMVLALLDGRKTQTRRVADPEALRLFVPQRVWSELPASVVGNGAWVSPGEHAVSSINPHGAVSVLSAAGQPFGLKPSEFEWVSPYGRPGEDLWVRETWHGEAQWNPWAPRDMVEGSCVWYAADGASNRPDVAEKRIKGKTRVSIHMPRWACRTLLHITAVRLERLHDISEADAQAEGITAEQAAACGGYVPAFQALWERVHNTFWDADNPWVWVVEFEVVKR